MSRFVRSVSYDIVAVELGPSVTFGRYHSHRQKRRSDVMREHTELITDALAITNTPTDTLTSSQSKYRHVYGDKSKVVYENAKVSGSAWDTNLVTASGVSLSHGHGDA
jgi:hypothetical protein